MKTIDFKNDIIIPAWELINTNQKIKTFYFFPSIFSVLFTSIIITYQFIYTYVIIFWKQQDFFQYLLWVFHSKYFVEIIIVVLVFFILYYLTIPIFESWLVKYIDQENNKSRISTIDAIWYWITKFLPVFEYNNIFSEFKIFFVFTSYLFLIRFIWVEYIYYINIAVIIYLFIATIVNVLFSYTKFEIILNNERVFKSAWISKQISIINLKTTIKLYLLMFFINIRVLINFLVFLFFPLLFVLAITYLTSKFFLTIAIIIITIIFIFFILFLSYLTAVFDVFKVSIWYYAYKIGRENIKLELDDKD